MALQSSPTGAPVSLLSGGGGDQISIGDTFRTLNLILGPVVLDGGDSTATVAFDETGAAVGRSYLFTAITGTDHLIGQDTASATNEQDFSYQHLGAIVLDAGNHGNTFTIRATGAAVDLHTGNGANSILAGDATNGYHLAFSQPLTIDGQSGTNQLAVNDQGTTTKGLTYTVGSTSVQASDAGTISYSHVKQLTLNSGKGGNTIDVVSTASGMTVDLNGGTGSDTLVGPSSANTWDVTGANAGTLQSSVLASTVTFASMTNLTGGASTDAFRIHTGGSISGNIDGKAGSNTLDYSAYTGDISADLLLKKVTAVTGLVTNLQNVTGSTGNDLIVGSGQAGTLRGGTGATSLSPRQPPVSSSGALAIISSSQARRLMTPI